MAGCGIEDGACTGATFERAATRQDFGIEWNAENQLVRVTKDAAEVARFAYDPLGRRVEKVAGATTASYAYDSEDILREGTSGDAVRYLHGLGTDEPHATEGGAQLLYEHADGLGSEIKRTDTSGALTTSRGYEVFGSPAAGAVAAGYAYTGREWDPEIGLYYYRARYYDPRVGRFVSEDPVRSFNLYLYVENNPITRVDPSGQFTITARSPVAIPQNKWNTVYEEVRRACCTIVPKINPPSLRACIQRSCEIGVVKLFEYCYPGELGGPNNPYLGRVMTGSGSAIRSLRLCYNRWPDIMQAGIGKIVIHEWAHGCGWFHGQGGDVPGDSGTF